MWLDRAHEPGDELSMQPVGLSLEGAEAWLVGQLIARRCMLGWSQWEAAERIGVDVAHLARWETRHWRPQPVNLFAWAAALGLRLALIEAPGGGTAIRAPEAGGGQKTGARSPAVSAPRVSPVSVLL